LDNPRRKDVGAQQYCYPLTVTDHASGYLLLCEALESIREELAITGFEQLFQERGLPQAIRSDNGVPFASANSLLSIHASRALDRRQYLIQFPNTCRWRPAASKSSRKKAPGLRYSPHSPEVFASADFSTRN
jgi:hypothetical protein